MGRSHDENDCFLTDFLGLLNERFCYICRPMLGMPVLLFTVLLYITARSGFLTLTLLTNSLNVSKAWGASLLLYVLF